MTKEKREKIIILSLFFGYKENYHYICGELFIFYLQQNGVFASHQ